MAIARVEFCWDSSFEETQDALRAVGDALTGALQVPPGDPTVIGVKRPREMAVAPSGSGDHYTIVTVTLFAGRTLETKRHLLREIVDGLGRSGIEKDDILVVLHDVPTSDWGIQGGASASEVDVGFRIDI